MKYFDPSPARRSPLRRALAAGAVFVAGAASLVPMRLVAKEPARPSDPGPLFAAPDSAPDSATKPDAPAAAAVEGAAPDEEVLLDLNQVSVLRAPEAALAAAADGIVRTVKVEEGQRVKAGEVLVELDRGRAAAELELAKADLELKAVELRRKQELFGEKSAGPSEVAEAEFGVTRARHLLAIKEHEMAQTHVVSPFDGVVVKVGARPGVFLARGSPAVTVIEADKIWAEVEVPPAGLAVLKKGTPAEIRPVGVPPPQEKTYAGRVISISPMIRAGSQTATVRVRPDGPAGDLMPGGSVKVRFLRDTAKE